MSDAERTCSTAVAYATLGWLVFPVWSVRDGRCGCGDPNCTRPGKHPHGGLAPHGLKNGTRDEATICKWFDNGNLLNLAVCTGWESGILVLDVDLKNDGEASLAALGKLPETATARSGGGGKHLYFKMPAEDIRSTAADKSKKDPPLGPGIDIRANGGYIIVPPSVHVSGAGYVWLRDPRGGIAELPSHILRRLVRKPAPSKWPEQVAAAPPADDRTKAIARACLDLLGPERTDSYDEWIQTGMACRLIGLSCEEYDKWSQRSGKYSPGEPARKWASFATTRQDTVGIGSLIHWAAQDQGITTGELLARISPDFHLTDCGNAERFAAEHAHCLRFVRDWGVWLEYDGRRWNRETGATRAAQLAAATARGILLQAAKTADDQQRARLAKWALQCEGAGRIEAMQRLAQTHPALSIGSQDLDQDPYLLNVANGTIHLRLGVLRPHDPADMLTKISPVEYDPGARLKVWDDHLLRVTGGDRNLIEFIQTAAGYTATGDVSEEVLFLIHGPTAGGKTTTVEALKTALGDYAQTTDFETFLKRNQVGGIRNDIARLAGARLVVSVEVDEGKQLAEGLVKMLTGGDTVSARFLHHEFFEFRPQCKLWLICNDAPRASDTDDALWRRIIRVPFEYTIPKHERDPQIKAMLKDPTIGGPAVLAWIVQGCAKWKSSGLIVPRAIEQATQDYRDSQDPLKEFFDDRCIFEADAKIPVKDLRTAYEGYAQECGIRYPLGPKEFNKRLEARGCRRTTTTYQNSAGIIYKDIKCWMGVRLARATDKQPTPDADSTEFDEEAPF